MININPYYLKEKQTLSSSHFTTWTLTRRSKASNVICKRKHEITLENIYLSVGDKILCWETEYRTILIQQIKDRKLQLSFILFQEQIG